jgi:hypothetical protein
VVERDDAQECQPEGRDPLEHTLKLGLVTHGANEHGLSPFADQTHPFECPSGVVTELPVDENAVFVRLHSYDGKQARGMTAGPHGKSHT